VSKLRGQIRLYPGLHRLQEKKRRRDIVFSRISRMQAVKNSTTLQVTADCQHAAKFTDFKAAIAS
jgi:hypothetical protein